MPRAWTTYPTSGVHAGGGGTPTVTGANVAEVLAGLAAYTGEGLAIATVSGQAPRLMAYDATDDAWYGTDGGDGSELTPYWTASTGEDGFDALPAASAGAYGVIGKGTGSPAPQRRLTLIADAWATGSDSSGRYGELLGPVLEWVSPAVYAYGTPSTVYGMDRTITPFTPTVGSGGAVNYGTTVAGRIAVRSGTAAGSNLSAVPSATTSSRLVAILKRITATGISTASGSNSVVRALTSSDSSQYLGIAAGGTAASNATDWHVPNSAAALVSTGVPIATEKRLVIDLAISTNQLSVYVDGGSDPAYSAASVATTGASTAATIVANPQNGASTTIQFEGALFLEWN